MSTVPSTHGRLVYAVGDIHGRLDLLEALVAEILEDMLESAPDTKPVLVFLGDYVDRGPDSAGVIEFILQLRAAGSIEVRALMGNHEETMLGFLENPGLGRSWVAHGGEAAMISYGVSPPRQGQPELWEQARDQLVAALPDEHLEFLRSLELMLEIGDYLFVHAGVRPGTPIGEQTPHDVMWIRTDFLKRPFDCGKVVVHGHTPSHQPEVLATRIGLDTGAYATGVLTAARLFGTSRTLIQASAGATRALAS